jgi:hypothetical protein
MAAEIDTTVTAYVAWAQDKGIDPDEVATLKAFQRAGKCSRYVADCIADALYIGGGESDWRRP